MSLIPNGTATDLSDLGTGFGGLAGNSAPGLTQLIIGLTIAAGVGLVILAIASVIKKGINLGVKHF